TDGGLAYFVNGRFTVVEGISGKSVTSFACDAGENFWIRRQYSGLLHLLKGRVVEATPWARLAREDYAWALAPDPVKHGLWLGFLRSGLAYFEDGQIPPSYGDSDGLGEGRVNGLRTDPDGTLWAATEGGLSRVKDGRVATLTHNNGLPCDSVGQVVEDDAHAFWLDTACGLVRIARPELDAWVTDRKRMVQ